MTTIKRLLAVLALVLAGAASHAASLADRSPFAQGHWWDPNRPGSGFDMFTAGGQAVVNWYTYDRAGKAVWYTAQGDAALLGRDAYPLLRHRWVNGRKADPVVVGGLRVSVRNSESAQLDWTVDGFSGTTTIVPFVQAGETLEVDHTGSWFAPDNNGWGFALTQQGNVLGGVLFAYDASGEPTWVSGFGRNTDRSVDLFRFTGPCPSCPYAVSSGTPAGRLAFDFDAEWQVTARATGLTMPIAEGVRIDGARMFQLSIPASARAADRQLATFDSAAALKAYLDVGMLNMVDARPAASDFSPAPPTVSIPYSTTNLQESGVDESDLVKFDGRFAYTFRHSLSGAREATVRIAELGSDGSGVAVRGAVALAGPPRSMESAGLYVAGGKLVSVAGTVPKVRGGATWAPSNAWSGGSTQVEIFDAAGGAATSRWYAAIDGHPVASRRIGDRLYVVTRFVPAIRNFFFGTLGSNIASNVSLLAATPLFDMVPKISVNGGAPAMAVQPTSMYSPPQGSTRPFADMIVVTSIDLANPRVADAIAIVGAVETVYVSPRNIYLATTRQDQRAPDGGLRPAPGLLYQITDLHQVALGDSGMSIVGSGMVEGILGTDLDKTPFRLSEDQGRLRIVSSTTMEMGWGIQGNRNRLTIMEPSRAAPGVLRTVSVLPNAGRPGMLGLPMEELYATRFAGDRLYAVTFTSARFANQMPTVDPLFVVDLSDATDPRIRGELVIPGFSDYLHPLANGLLLGFGRSVTTTGIAQGLQLSLFDVSDDANPRAIQQVVIGKRGSDSALLQSHHALSALPTADGNLAIAFPARIHDGAIAFGSGDSATYAWQQSGLARYLVSGSTPSTARLVELPALVTHKTPFTQPFPDAAADGARSILFPGATVYVANGQFWRQEVAAAGVVSGPF
ncbi:MAG: beta-propeller domain-containing protein [Betaproteobacteria bacterium]